MPTVTIYSLHHSEHPLTTYLHCRWQEQKAQNQCHYMKPHVEMNAQSEHNTSCHLLQLLSHIVAFQCYKQEFDGQGVYRDGGLSLGWTRMWS